MSVFFVFFTTSNLQTSPSPNHQPQEDHTIVMATFNAKDNINTTPSSPPTIFQILQQSFRLPTLNIKATVAILLFLIVPFTLLFLTNNSVIKSIALDVIVKTIQKDSVQPGSPEYYELLSAIKKDMVRIFADEALFILAFAIVSLFGALATTHASAAAYTGKELSIRELFSNIIKGWKQPLITILYTQFFSLGFVLLITLLVGFVALLYKTSSVMVAIGVLAIVFCAIFYLYLTVVWTQAIVVSVVEEGCYGLAAIGRAGQLIRGRKMQGLALVFLFMVVAAIVSGASALPMSNVNLNEFVRLVLGCVLVSLSCVIGFFQSVVFTVFYFACKMHQGEEVHNREFLGYSLVSSATHVDSV